MPTISSMPSITPSTPSATSIRLTSITRNIIGYSRRRVSERTTSGTTSAVTPSTRAMLVMFEPSALPTAIPLLPSSVAITEIRISGDEVPRPTIVSPITMVEIPILRAVAAAPCTNQSAAFITTTKPTITAAKESNNSDGITTHQGSDSTGAYDSSLRLRCGIGWRAGLYAAPTGEITGSIRVPVRAPVRDPLLSARTSGVPVAAGCRRRPGCDGVADRHRA